MIFDKCEDIERDIKSKIFSYITINNNCNTKDLVSIIRSYLYEMKLIKEVDSYSVDEISMNKFNIHFVRCSICYMFGVSLDLELRNMKINKIKSSNISK